MVLRKGSAVGKRAGTGHWSMMWSFMFVLTGSSCVGASNDSRGASQAGWRTDPNLSSDKERLLRRTSLFFICALVKTSRIGENPACESQPNSSAGQHSTWRTSYHELGF